MTLELTDDQAGVIKALLLDFMHCPEWPQFRPNWEHDMLAILAMLEKNGTPELFAATH